MTPTARTVGTLTKGAGPRRRSAQARTYLMCPPEYFEVRYAINPWMNPADPVDLALARQQWALLRAAYLGLGHTVRTIEPQPGLSDMVFAANGGIVVGGKGVRRRVQHPERHAQR